MRKIFGGAMLFSAVGATILGGALAWNDTQISGPQTVDVGTVGFAIEYVPAPDALLGPNDGIPNRIGGGRLSNTGDLNLFWANGEVQFFNVDAQHATCNVSNFAGAVTPILDLGNGGELSAGAVSQEGYVVDAAVLPVAPEACQGATVSYVVAITMSTQPAN